MDTTRPTSGRTGSGRFEQRESLTLWRPEAHGDEAWLSLWVTTRLGGTSPAPYATLNLGLATGDSKERVGANVSLLQRSLGLEGVPWHRLRQVHGNRVVAAGEAGTPEADGIWTHRPQVVLVVGVADCVPIFLWDRRRRRVALLHAGWRGTVAGVVSRGVTLLRADGSELRDLWMSMGPSIGPCCFEVGPEVSQALPDAVVSPSPGKVHVDLRQANRRRALECGVPATQIHPDPPCTGCDATHFFSHRKLGPRTGRQWALAWMLA